MPVPPEPTVKSLQQIAEELDVYPVEAFVFVHQGLTQTVKKIHGEAEEDESQASSRHVTGPQLCQGLRELALLQWGLLARTVLQRWNITSTLDFGKIVFALIEGGRLRKTEGDKLEDFRNVFDFRTAFDGDYRIEHKT